MAVIFFSKGVSSFHPTKEFAYLISREGSDVAKKSDC